MGEAEVWKDIAGYEGFYQVSNMGRVKRVEHTDKMGHTYKERILKQPKTPNGYLHVHLSKNEKTTWQLTHRLVAQAFCEKPDGCDIVNHLDNNHANNSADNLEWTTYQGNMQWASKQGRMKAPAPKVVAASIAARIKPVIAISKSGEEMFFPSIAEAERILGVSHNHIAAVCRQDYGYKTAGGYKFQYA